MQDQLISSPTYVLVLLYTIIFLLYLIVPGTTVRGYVTDLATGQKLMYHLNGLRVYAICVIGYCVLCYYHFMPWGLLYEHRWGCIIAANVIGIVASIAFYLRGDPKKKYKKNTRKAAPPGTEGFGISFLKWLDDFYLGLEDNPHWGVFDAKMFLYLIGGTVLNLNVISFAAHQYQLRGSNDVDTSTFIYVILFSYFIVEYLFHEHVHLYTWDFIGEKIGFKLVWGCLVFFPMFYPVGAWTIANNPHRPLQPISIQIASVVCFFSGWMLARGANNQKYLFKTNPNGKFLGLIEPKVIGGNILCSGFWGVSRHVNYLGELLESVGLALAADYTNYIAWLYTVYYFVLFIPRELADDKRCHAKYGKDWEEYRKRVPYRIIPYVY